jgi:hypothetical protein
MSRRGKVVLLIFILDWIIGIASIGLTLTSGGELAFGLQLSIELLFIGSLIHLAILYYLFKNGVLNGFLAGLIILLAVYNMFPRWFPPINVISDVNYFGNISIAASGALNIGYYSPIFLIILGVAELICAILFVEGLGVYYRKFILVVLSIDLTFTVALVIYPAVVTHSAAYLAASYFLILPVGEIAVILSAIVYLFNKEIGGTKKN